MVGFMHHRAFDADQLGMLDLDRLDVMEFGCRRRFGHMHCPAAERSAACGDSRQFCQCHTNRHDCCLTLRSRAKAQVKAASTRVGCMSRHKQRQIALRRATQLTMFGWLKWGHIGIGRRIG
jgi:hypothetical protein